jgi:histidine triad (HIT) family protein
MTDCTFCAIAAGTVPARVVLADETTVAFLDARPVFPGHVLAVPRAHFVTLADLPATLVKPYFAAVQLISAAIPAALGAQGTFVAINNTVSQSVPHLHTHIVPRTKGDGLRGFFWPRSRYESDEQAEGYAARIRGALTDLGPPGGSGPAGSPALCQQRNAISAGRVYPDIYG